MAERHLPPWSIDGVEFAVNRQTFVRTTELSLVAFSWKMTACDADAGVWLSNWSPSSRQVLTDQSEQP